MPRAERPDPVTPVDGRQGVPREAATDRRVGTVATRRLSA